MLNAEHPSDFSPAHVRILGVLVSSPLALAVTARLRREGSVVAADAIETALMHGIPIIRLTAGECKAVLSVLVDPPPQLARLRDVVRDAYAQHMHDLGTPQRYPADELYTLEDAGA